jgi:NAD(P)-dependent dehydrogenase (short-subunit alcohol dehydrogenase family)
MLIPPVQSRGGDLGLLARQGQQVPGSQRQPELRDRGGLVNDEEDWWKVIDTNLVGTFYLIQVVLAGMRRAGGGNIVIIASEWGVIGRRPRRIRRPRRDSSP